MGRGTIQSTVGGIQGLCGSIVSWIISTALFESLGALRLSQKIPNEPDTWGWITSGCICKWAVFLSWRFYDLFFVLRVLKFHNDTAQDCLFYSTYWVYDFFFNSKNSDHSVLKISSFSSLTIFCLFFFILSFWNTYYFLLIFIFSFFLFYFSFHWGFGYYSWFALLISEIFSQFTL